MKRHKHKWTGLWWHFGSYGRQDVHVYDCLVEGCLRVLIGVGRECGQGEHHRETLSYPHYDDGIGKFGKSGA